MFMDSTSTATSCFRTLNVEVYHKDKALKAFYNVGFRTLNVEVYQLIKNCRVNCYLSFRTLNVEVYRECSYCKELHYFYVSVH